MLATRHHYTCPSPSPIPSPIPIPIPIPIPSPSPEQAILILAARHHYSVDVVVALYTVPLLWSWWGHAFPHDLVPDDARIAAFVLGRDRERHRQSLNGASHDHSSRSLSELPEHVTNHVL